MPTRSASSCHARASSRSAHKWSAWCRFSTQRPSTSVSSLLTSFAIASSRPNSRWQSGSNGPRSSAARLTCSSHSSLALNGTLRHPTQHRNLLVGELAEVPLAGGELDRAGIRAAHLVPGDTSPLIRGAPLKQPGGGSPVRLRSLADNRDGVDEPRGP